MIFLATGIGNFLAVNLIGELTDVIGRKVRRGDLLLGQGVVKARVKARVRLRLRVNIRVRVDENEGEGESERETWV